MRNLYLILVLAASLAPFANVQAAPADVPETGQTTCFDAAGTVILCAGTGQDGDLKAGVAWPNPRFVVGAGATAECVTDNLTGLMWVRSPDQFAGWATALDNADIIMLCGFSDWRLPNVNELESLVNSQAANQAIVLNTQGFSNVQASNYWSSSSSAIFSDTAWVVSMSDGSVDTNIKSIGNHAWMVRAGP